MKRMQLTSAEVAVIERLRQDARHFNDGLDAAIEALKDLEWPRTVGTDSKLATFVQCEQAINRNRKDVL